MIINDINKCFEIDENINELGIYFDETTPSPPPPPIISDNTNTNNNKTNNNNNNEIKKEIYFILSDHKLGLPLSCLHQFFHQSHNHFFHALADKAHMDKKGEELSEEVKKYLYTSTRALLLISADVTTAWNIRKLLINLLYIDMNEELLFIALILTKHPKKPSCWYHRQWVFQQLIKTTTINNKLLENEIIICTNVVHSYPKNYYAWSHRQFIFSLYDDVDAMCRDLYTMYDWMYHNISDHSAINHLEYLLQIIYEKNSNLFIQKKEDIKECLIDYCFNRLNTLLMSYSNHQCLWLFRSFLFTLKIGIYMKYYYDRNQLNIFFNIPEEEVFWMDHPSQLCDIWTPILQQQDERVEIQSYQQEEEDDDDDDDNNNNDDDDDDDDNDEQQQQDEDMHFWYIIGDELGYLEDHSLINDDSDDYQNKLRNIKTYIAWIGMLLSRINTFTSPSSTTLLSHTFPWNLYNILYNNNNNNINRNILKYVSNNLLLISKCQI